jgi:hypothetical protein
MGMLQYYDTPCLTTLSLDGSIKISVGFKTATGAE